MPLRHRWRMLIDTVFVRASVIIVGKWGKLRTTAPVTGGSRELME